MFRKILLAFGHAEGDKRALEVAMELAHLFQAGLCVLVIEKRAPRYPATVGEVEEAKELAEQSAHALLSQVYLRALQAGVSFQGEVRAGSVTRTILEMAESGHFDLLVLGTTAPLTILRVSHHAPCSVLLVR